MPTLETFLASAGFGMPGGPEMLIVLAIILVIFGPKRLPALSRSIGRSITDFKRGLNDMKSDIESAGDDADKEAEAAKMEAKAVTSESSAK